MNGTITFPLPSNGIAKFALDSIYNVHTDGAGVLTFNVIAATTEFTFTCEDEAAAVRIANLIFTLREVGSDANFVVGDNVNYPLPPAPATTNALLYYDYSNNRWYAESIGTGMGVVASVVFAGVNRSLVTVTPTYIKTEFIDKPDYGSLAMDYVDSKGNVLGSTTVEFHYTINTFTPNPFIAGVDDFVVNGSDFDGPTIGKVRVEEPADTVYASGYCPAILVNSEQISLPAVDWQPGDGVFVPPCVLFYEDSLGKISNRLYIDSIT
jgi:hypothetical protein